VKAEQAILAMNGCTAALCPLPADFIISTRAKVAATHPDTNMVTEAAFRIIMILESPISGDRMQSEVEGLARASDIITGRHTILTRYAILI
jgi:hypothetical protein